MRLARLMLARLLSRGLAAKVLAGVFAAVFAGVLVGSGAIASAAPTTGPSALKTASKQPIVAVFRFDSDLSESPGDTLSLFGKQKTSLRDVVDHLRKAADDADVKAVVLLSEGGSMGFAQLEELHQALERVKQAGKPIFVHSDSMDMRQYALFSCADHIGMVPTADLWLTGLYAESPYLRGLLDKVGVHPDFLHCGDYKSYAEIYMREGPSPEAEQMENWLLDSIYDTAVNVIASGRKVDAAKVKEWIDNAPYTASTAKAAGLIDAVEHRADFEAMIRDKIGENVVFEKSYGEPKQPTLDLSSPFAFFKIWSDLLNDQNEKQSDKPAIGVVYVDGEISLGSGDDSPFSSGGGAHSDDLRKALDEAANDDNIKAVVLRIDSPGGSATASEVILDATQRLKAKKPLIVSMGDVAGSGGYYVACASDIIFADRSTITASIGVVGGKMVTNDMWNKVGVTFKDYGRGKNAGIMSTSHVWDDAERKIMSDYMNDVYGVFKSHVIAIRGKRLKKPIEELAGGRVFTGQQALDLGLVDKLGTLQDTIDYIAASTKLGNDYDVRVVPKPKNFLEKIMDQSSGANDDPGHVLVRAARGFIAQASQGSSIVDLAMPYLQHLDPQRVAQIRAALHTLDMMQTQGVLLTTPQLMMSK